MKTKMKTSIGARKLIQWTLSGIGIAIILGYSYFVLEDFARGPRIIISTPENGFSTTTPAILIIGKAIHTNNLTINDASTSLDLDGNFRTRLILAPGYNIIKISGKDAYARTVEKIIEISLLKGIIDTGAGTTTQATTTIN